MKRQLLCVIFCLASVHLVSAQTEDLSLDLNTIPFSRYGSYMCLTLLKGENDSIPAVYLRDVSGNLLWGWNGIFRLETTEDGKIVPSHVSAGADLMTLWTAKGKVEIVFSDSNTVRLRGKNIGLKITRTLYNQNSYLIPVSADQWRLKMGSNAEYAVTKLKGNVSASGPRYGVRAFGKRERLPPIIFFAAPGIDGIWETVVEQYVSAWKPKDYLSQSFDQARLETRKSFMAFYEKTPPVSPNFEETRKLAAYVNWSSVVSPRNNMKAHAMYMSKRHMHAVWSWDHCFNALASSGIPDLAWENFALPFTYQLDAGSLPDIMNDNTCTWGFLKPPIHGWTLHKLIDKGIVNARQLSYIYERLVKWTDYWFTYMDDDHDGVPQYNHGNDSGWDNCTAFDLGFSVESPDLCAFLVLQMEALSEVAGKLGKHKEAVQWKNRSEKLLQLMIRNFWKEGKFTISRTLEGDVNLQSQSLMPFIPLILGRRLPDDIRKQLISDLKKPGGLITEYGIATEVPASPLYESDGYWRGSIWAPTTYFMVCALNDCGEKDLARTIALRFCEMCKKNGFGENFNALTGNQQHDTGYTWTASVFLLLASEYAK